MTYVTVGWNQADFGFSGEGYVLPLDPKAVTLDLADSGGGGLYRKPPLAVSSSYLNYQASVVLAEIMALQSHEEATHLHPKITASKSNQASGVYYIGGNMLWGFVPVRDSIPSAYSGISATPIGKEAMLYQFQDFLPKDDPDGFGAQAWDLQPPKDTLFDQEFGEGDDKESHYYHTARTSVLNWQAPPPEAIEIIQSEVLNLIAKPYVPPQALETDFELVPEDILREVVPPTRSVDAAPNIPGWERWSFEESLDGRTFHPWDRKPRIGTEVDFPNTAEPNLPPPEPPEEPETKRTYRIMNSSSVVEVSTGTPLEFRGLKLSLDVDSFSWSMTCSILNTASMNLIKPTAAGPAEVDVTVNGRVWRVFVSSYSIEKKFPKVTYSIKCFSRHQLLASPYAPKTTGRIEVNTGVVQAMTEQLQYTGFSVSQQSGLSDFVIPADVWGWKDKTAIEVITELAKAQGAVVVPDMNADVLHINHRYKQVGPWDYPSQDLTFVDHVVQDTMTLGYSSSWEPGQEVNTVFVSGVTAGVSVNVVRTGTAGDKAADDIFDDLNVDSTQCRERGLTAIAASGDQEVVSIELPLPTSGAPGLILPSSIIEFRDTVSPGNDWRGVVLGLTLSIDKPGSSKVIQNISVERHHYLEEG